MARGILARRLCFLLLVVECCGISDAILGTDRGLSSIVGLEVFDRVGGGHGGRTRREHLRISSTNGGNFKVAPPHEGAVAEGENAPSVRKEPTDRRRRKRKLRGSGDRDWTRKDEEGRDRDLGEDMFLHPNEVEKSSFFLLGSYEYNSPLASPSPPRTPSSTKATPVAGAGAKTAAHVPPNPSPPAAPSEQRCSCEVSTYDELFLAIESAEPGQTISICNDRDIVWGPDDAQINLTGRQLSLTCCDTRSKGASSSCTFDCNGPTRCGDDPTIAAEGCGRCLASDGGHDVSFVGLTVKNGRTFGRSGKTDGAAVRLAGGGSLYFSDGAFLDNSAEATGGGDDAGAIYLEGGTSHFERVRFMGNAGEEGGAIFMANHNSSISDASFSANVASSGGAVFVTGSSSLALEGTTFNLNTATLLGGAVRVVGNSRLILGESAFDANQCFSKQTDACGNAVSTSGDSAVICDGSNEFVQLGPGSTTHDVVVGDSDVTCI